MRTWDSLERHSRRRKKKERRILKSRWKNLKTFWKRAVKKFPMPPG
ncbi:hypothetical protein [Methanobrevibacter sp.]|nr:hypothetical protein [Methanobrevibacter sp.]MDO5859569.1 hypothetical protein [Methanobrevibacter sp.]